MTDLISERLTILEVAIEKLHTIEQNQIDNKLLMEQNNEAVQELLEWVRNAKASGKLVSRFASWIGRQIILIGKIAVGVAMIWGLWEAFIHGKVPVIEVK